MMVMSVMLRHNFDDISIGAIIGSLLAYFAFEKSLGIYQEEHGLRPTKTLLVVPTAAANNLTLDPQRFVTSPDSATSLMPPDKHTETGAGDHYVDSPQQVS